MLNWIYVKKRIHKGWIERENAKKKYPGIKIRPLFKKYQYLYIKRKWLFWKTDIISLIGFHKWLYEGYCWEIYCLKGKVFDGTERFKTKKDAEKVIMNYLKKDI